MEKSVSQKQFIIILFIVGVSTKIFMLPALLLNIAGRDSYFVLLAYMVLEFLMLTFLLIIMKKYPKLTFYELQQKTMGKVGSRIFLSIILIYYFVKLTLMISEIKIFFTVSATENLSWDICVIPLLAVFVLMTVKPLRSLGRISEIMIPYILFTMIVMGIIMAINLDLRNLFPILADGPDGIVYGLTKLPMWLGDFSIIAIFMGRVEKQKKLMTASLVTTLISFAAVLYFNIVMFASYGNVPDIVDYGHNITNMTVYSIGYYNFGRVDIVVYCIWMTSIIINTALLFYVISRHIGYITKITNKYLTGIIAAVIAFVMIEFVFADDQTLFSYAASIFSYLAFFTEYVAPTAMFFVAMLSKKKLQPERRLLNEQR